VEDAEDEPEHEAEPGDRNREGGWNQCCADERDERHADEQHDLANRVPLEEGGRAAE